MIHKVIRLLILTFAFISPLQATALFSEEEPLLDAEEAFKILATHVHNKQMLRIEYAIAEGYYLYRHRFAFKSLSADIKLGTAQIPEGEMHDDEYFGNVETYRHQIIITVPYEFVTNIHPDTFELQAISQGCADAGVCYPVLTQITNITLRP